MTAGNDISWALAGQTFNLRVAGIITRGEEILICAVGGLGYWFLPGGRVRLGEPAEAALARDDLDGGHEPDHRFRWAAVGELGSLVPFQPAGLIPALAERGAGLRHIVLDRGNG